MVTEIGKRIKQLREIAGLNQAQIAAFLDVDQSTISKCEKGERHFTVDMLERIGNLFGLSLSELEGDAYPQNALSFAFRADDIRAEDLKAIADINLIALNLSQMERWISASTEQPTPQADMAQVQKDCV